MAPSASIYIGPFGAMVSIWALPCILGPFHQVLLLLVVQLDADQSFNENMMVMVMVMVMVIINTCQPTPRAASQLPLNSPLPIST